MAHSYSERVGYCKIEKDWEKVYVWMCECEGGREIERERKQEHDRASTSKREWQQARESKHQQEWVREQER